MYGLLHGSAPERLKNFLQTLALEGQLAKGDKVSFFQRVVIRIQEV